MKPTLIDTECWLWWHLAPERLGASAMALLEERRSPLLFSAASSWEIAIKVGLGKLELPAALATVSALACLLPARQATRVDPMTALRYE